jgi:hypothetical protein
MEPEDWRTFNTKSLLGGAMLGQKIYPEAEPLLLAGYEGMKQREDKIPRAAEMRLKDSLERLIDLYTAMDKPDEVTKWQADRSKSPSLADPPTK